VRGMNVMLGYLDDPVGTAEAIDAAGWFHTGDIGILDDVGYLRITDRKKDMFIVGGFNCYPAEIEKMLMAHPAVLQVAVVGVPDDRLGEVPWAYIVIIDGAVAPDAAELEAVCRAHLAPYKVPVGFTELDELPRNEVGKVLKRELQHVPR